MSEATSDKIDRILSAKTDNFVELVREAGLSPARDFRRARLRKVDFSGCDLNSFDFSEAIFDQCHFGDALYSLDSMTHARFVDCDIAGPAPLSPVPVQPPHECATVVSEKQPMDPPTLLKTAAQWLTDEQRHPVLLIGPPGSGKTSLIYALLETLQQTDRVMFRVAPPMRAVRPDSADLVEGEVYQNFLLDEQPFARTTSGPEFHCLDLFREGVLEPLRIAVMDYAGELLNGASLESDTDRLPAVITDVFRNLPGSLSLIYLQAADRSAKYGFARRPDITTEQVLEAYQRLRRKQARDAHLLLLTKWDMLHERHDGLKHSLWHVLRDEPSYQWQRFFLMRPSKADQHAVYAHSAFTGDPIIGSPMKAFRPAMPNDASRVVINWIYANVLRSKRPDVRAWPRGPLLPGAGGRSADKPIPMRSLLPRPGP